MGMLANVPVSALRVVLSRWLQCLPLLQDVTRR